MTLIFEQYRAAILAAAAALVAVLLFVAGWKVCAWRDAGKLAAKDAEIAKLSSDLTLQNARITALGVEQAAAAKAASAAQAEALQARAQVKTRIVTVMQSPASSCADVLRDQWGKL